MAMMRSYVMIAAPGQIDILEQALRELAAKISACDGTEGTELYQDLDHPEHLTFLERWTSPEAQEAAGKVLGKEAFAPIMAALAAPPTATSLGRLI
ncbi:putative quinol monooxygenase [Sphingobium sp. CFD-1]|uniref:putative quinol monooxygenase n=1 Tax=Sphingobium sp. CFD-1 TaxID=2878545 RepID=UPI00214B6BCC|nr:antibiotic biosynthesis monooxygenase family protein [Sphingobium sp. CFD-1]